MLVMNLPRKVLIPETTIFSTIAEEGVLLDIDAGTYYSLSTTASFLWTQWMKDGSVEQAIDQLVDAFAVDRATAKSDVRELVEDLLAKRLLIAGEAE
jgi:hypothetical protein